MQRNHNAPQLWILTLNTIPRSRLTRNDAHRLEGQRRLICTWGAAALVTHYLFFLQGSAYYDNLSIFYFLSPRNSTIGTSSLELFVPPSGPFFIHSPATKFLFGFTKLGFLRLVLGCQRLRVPAANNFKCHFLAREDYTEYTDSVFPYNSNFICRSDI